MEYRNLGRSGVKVSPLCLGTMNFGPYTTEEDSFEIMSRALEAGINFFDTANVYGGEGEKGSTEKIVGRWLAQGGGRRESVVLATKVFGRMTDGPNDRGLSAVHIRRACEASLERLQTDYIDLYQMHHVDRDTSWDEIWQAMEQLVREGKVVYVGSSNFAGWHIAQASESARRRNFMGLVAEQSLFNLTERSVELEVLPACREYGLGVIPWSPLAMGALAGPPAEETVRTKKEWAEKVRAKHGDRFDRYWAFCEEKGESPAVVALAWLLANPAVTAPIIGPRTLAQLEASLPVPDVSFTEEELKALDDIFPGPGGPAPEAYAW